MGKSIFPDPPKCYFMLINSKTTRPISFFFHQKKRNYYLGNYKKNIAALKCESEKTKCWVPWFPLMQLSVKEDTVIHNILPTYFSIGTHITNKQTKQKEHFLSQEDGGFPQILIV